VNDEEWAFVIAYLTLCRLDAEQRDYDLRWVFNALHWLVRTGASWRMMPHDFPPWSVVYQQMQRWLRAGCFESMVNDLRVLLRAYAGRHAQPSAMARWCSTAARCSPHRNLEHAPVTTVRSGAREQGSCCNRYAWTVARVARDARERTRSRASGAIGAAGAADHG